VIWFGNSWSGSRLLQVACWVSLRVKRSTCCIFVGLLAEIQIYSRYTLGKSRKRQAVDAAKA
jgi:hypothetical protein